MAIKLTPPPSGQDPLAQMGQSAVSPVTPTGGLTPEQIQELMRFLQSKQGEVPPATFEEANPTLAPPPPSEPPTLAPYPEIPLNEEEPMPMPNAYTPRSASPGEAQSKFLALTKMLGRSQNSS